MGTQRAPARHRRRWGLPIAALALAFVAAPLLEAEARPARCFATDEGRYACDFVPLNRDGSFRISAPGKATYILNMLEPGVAEGFLNLGQRNISLPGQQRRSRVLGQRYYHSAHMRLVGRRAARFPNIPRRYASTSLGNCGARTIDNKATIVTD